MFSRSLALVLLGGLGLAAGCETQISGRGNDGSCTLGDAGCECHPNKTCNGELTCRSELCVDLSGDGDGDGDGLGGASSTASGGTTSVGGARDDVGGTASSGGGTADGGESATGGVGSESVGGGEATGGASAAGGSFGSGGTSAGGGSGGGQGCGVGSGWVTDKIGTSDPWRGEVYGFELNSSTLSESYENDGLCISGRLGQSTDDFALVWWNIAQEFDDKCFASDPVAIDPGGKGISVSYRVSEGPDLRVVIHTEAGGDFCAEISAQETEATVLWNEFHTDCFAAQEGTSYSGQAIFDITVGPFGSSAQSLPYDFCVTSIRRAE